MDRPDFGVFPFVNCRTKVMYLEWYSVLQFPLIAKQTRKCMYADVDVEESPPSPCTTYST